MDGRTRNVKRTNIRDEEFRRTGKRTRNDSVNTSTADDFYFSALLDQDEIFLISDETYAEKLQIQETLIASSCSKTPIQIESLSSSSSSKTSHQQQQQQLDSYCAICFDRKTSSEMFHNIGVCSHTFCLECIREHVAARIKENVAVVVCPEPECKGEIGPQVCRSIVPKQVLDRWEDVLCESLIMGSEKFYCPFKDCSAMLVDNGGLKVTSSECPHCHRLFCAQCKVAWHAGMDCIEYNQKKDVDASDLKLKKMAKNKKWKRCPSCAYYVEKIDGCNHIKCRCGYEFCYRCGKKYSGRNQCRCY
ncbi:E3 ubiquitin-protein ligase RSL1-like [Rutidosis leptorrhynchoides]|uniref:E3 ubiquitin-protein ligase RSL1-like n=1 Tax=Rutidosis leptorrhynchoides TaxID=125765 RepID=UPI003A99FCE2